MSSRRADIEEQVVGRLLIRVTKPEGVEAPYRGGAGMLRLERRGEDTMKKPPWTRGPVVLAFILMAMLITFAGVTRTGAAIGTVSIAVLALLYLVIRGERRASAVSWVELDGGTVRAGGDGDPVQLGADRIEQVDVGHDGAYRSVFVRVREEGRVPLLYGLDEAEATAARDALTAAL